MQQENIKRRLISNSAGIFAIRALPAAAFLLSAILLSRRLAPADYGVYQGFWSQILLYSSLACIGLPSLLITIPASSAQCFIPESRLVKSMIAGAITIASALLWMLGERIASPLTGFILLSCITLSAIIEVLLLQASRVRQLLLMNALYALAFVSFHVLLVKGHFSIRTLFTAISILSLLKLGASLGMLSGRNAVPDFPDNKMKADEHFSLWRNLALYDATQYIFKWVDKAILVAILPPAMFAVYFNGTYDVPFLPLLLGAAGSTLLLHFSKTPQNAEAQARLQNRAALLMSNIVFPAFFFLAIFRNELFAVIFSARYSESAALFLVAILVLPLRTYNFTTLLQHAGKGRIINAGALLDLLLALALMWPLYLLWGLRGVALSFVISTYIQAAFYLIISSKLLGISIGALMPFGQLILRFILFGIGYMILYYALRPQLSASALLLLGAIFSSVIAAIPLLRARFRN